ncbi:MAG: type II toxin-antitoxin system VapC family toxin [Azospirillaceae bacterium]|nr:type II toxin-antitoxin system VapC family toxin [Azospirillaceae bacterium]
MIVLDTNVVSEAMKPAPDPAVLTWLNNQAAETLYLSTVTLAELSFGIKNLPEGRRKDALAHAADRLLPLFDGRVLPFDAQAAHHYATLAVVAKQRGLGFPMPDSYIAAIADSRGFIVASRDTRPYEASGVAVINPWAKGNP